MLLCSLVDEVSLSVTNMNIVTHRYIARQRAIHAASNIGVVVSVLWSDLRLYNRSSTRMERVLVICEVGRLAIAL
jgi:hypothetical protein